MKTLMLSLALLSLVLIGLSSACVQKQEDYEVISAAEISPVLQFQVRGDDPDYQFTAPRSFTSDRDGNFYIFDYMDNVIRKFDKNGDPLLFFGGKGENPGEFSHLMAVKVFDDFLYALDSIAFNKFDLNGHFLERMEFPMAAVCNYPQIFAGEKYVGEYILADELKKALIVRNIDGEVLARLTEYDLREFFPELKEGEDFYLQDTHARNYCYDFSPDGSVIWAISDEGKVYESSGGDTKVLYSGNFNLQDFPSDTREEMEVKKNSLKENFPSLHMFVPESYQLILHLQVAINGDIWVYLRSQQRTGFLILSPDGREKGFVRVAADFDAVDAIIRIEGDRLYFMVVENKILKIYSVPLPE
ncbi:hypothetical protein ACFLT9_08930 [Acidobacteriota bacterium]